ncbi:MAG TPA: peptide deformylase [Kiritimatiellia bacterium]|nr:peptide deformylase [Kiritimatiellia bacterium]
MNHEIRIYDDPVLRVKADPITRVDDEVRALGQEMITIMRQSEGVGLAAQQIGETRAICVIEVPEEYDLDDDGNRLNPELAMPMVLINPVISAPSKKEVSREEGCLSFPGIRGSITRPRDIHLTCLDEKGNPVDVDVRGFTARVIQHEVDHLNGILFIDRMSAARRFTLGPKLKRLKEEYGDK